jgi:hypothetical protein
MIEVAGSEQLADPRNTPVWHKTVIKRQGHMLLATTYMVVGKETRVFRHSEDLRPIARAVLAAAKRQGLSVEGDYDDYDDDDVEVGFKFNPIKRKDKSKRTGGFFGKDSGISKAVKTVGKSRIIQKVAKPILKVGKVLGDIATSKVFRGILAGTAAVFAATGIGAPIGAALAGASVGLTAVAAYKDNAKAIHGQLQKIKPFRDLESKLKKLGSTERAQALKDPRVQKALAEGKKAVESLKVLKTDKGKLKIRKLKENSDKAREHFKNIADTARFSKDPIARDHARKLARIVKIAAETRAKVKGIAEKNAGGLPGLFIDQKGRIRKGNFSRTVKKAGSTPGLLYNPKGGNRKGRFVRKVSHEEAVKLRKLKKLAAKQKELASKTRGAFQKTKAYRDAAAKAKKAARDYAKTKKSASNARKSDSKKAVSSVLKARKKGMSRKNRLRLAKGLKARMASKNKARSKAVATKKKGFLGALSSFKRVAASAKKVASSSSSSARPSEAVVRANTAMAKMMAIRKRFNVAGEHLANDIAGCGCGPEVGACIRIAGTDDMTIDDALRIKDNAKALSRRRGRVSY